MASSAQKSPGTWGLVHRRDQATRKWGLRSAIRLLEQRTSLVERYHLARLGCHHWLMAGTLTTGVTSCAEFRTQVTMPMATPYQLVTKAMVLQICP